MDIKKTLALATGLLVLPLAGCDVDQTEAGELPDVEVEEGNMPEYDVETPDVEMETDTITVPDPELEPSG